MIADHDIIVRILAGDTHHFSVLVDRYKDRAFALACRLLGNREEAEEILQDAFVKAYRSLADFRGESRFGTWFYRIVYNACMTRVSRRHGGAASLDDPETTGGEWTIASDDRDALETIEREERCEILDAELQKLPEKFRAVLVLFYVQGQKYEEIASILNLPLSTVKTHLFRARALLRNRVLDRYKEDMRAA
jgi:RNA polymerase sigma-70 factor (ECF subfamily)